MKSASQFIKLISSIYPRLSQTHITKARLVVNLSRQFPSLNSWATKAAEVGRLGFQRQDTSLCLFPLAFTFGLLRAKCDDCAKTPIDCCPPPPCPPPCPPPSPPPCSVFMPEEDYNCAPVTSRCNIGCSSSPIKWEPVELSHEFLVKQACIVAVDSVTRILTETVCAIENYNAQYREHLKLLMNLLNQSRSAPECAQELLSCKMVVIRSRLEELRRMIIELECYLISVERLANTTAEVAYLGNAEYASIALSERLHSVLLEAKTIKTKTTEMERDMMELQAVIIVETGNSLK